MTWSERQRAMLEVMGLRVWSPPEAQGQQASEAPAVLVDEPAPAEAVRMAAPRAPLRERAPAAPPAASEAVDAAGLDWPALREAVASCTACPLAQSRTQTVFGTGHPQAHWMIVGEAPGEAEDLSGEPFVGRSGQLLDNMLRAIGLGRDGGDAPDAATQVFIANTLKCRPPGNRNPQPEELARCEGFLIRQIELVRPKIILAMGSFAVQSLLRSSAPIGQLRGRVHSYQGVPLIVTYHPAYLLRQPTEKAKAWDDLCLALDTLAAADAASPAVRD
jgi:uracil-DNA glycosylase family 4